MKQFTTDSGAQVEIGVAGFEDFIKLKNAASREFAKRGIDIKGLNLTKDLDVGSLLSAFMMIESSQEVFECLFKCLDKSLYNGKRINKATFEPEEARQDYYPIILEFIKVNAAPFLSKKASELLDKVRTMFTAIQK